MNVERVEQFSSVRWWQALNPAVYLVSILPGVAVWLLAEKPFSHTALGLATLAVVLLQHGINLLNDAKDWQLGADTFKYDSWVRIHDGSVRTAFYHGLISLTVGGALGLLVLLFVQQLWILVFALPLAVLGVLYNAGQRPLSYTAAGELATALCYGPGVFGGLWFVAEQPFGWSSLLGMGAFAAFATALLFSHQPPQIETDRQAGKQCFAVRHGAVVTYRVSAVLLATTLGLLALAFGLGSRGLASTLPFVLASVVAVIWVVRVGPNPKRMMLSSTLVFLVEALSRGF